MMIRVIVLVSVLSLAITGCTIRLTDFTVVSIKNSNIPAKSVGKRVIGENCVFSWFGIAWFGTEPNLKEAFDQAMISAGSDFDALVDTVVYRKNGFTKNCYEVKGTAISTKK